MNIVDRDRPAFQERILILAPIGQDAELARQALAKAGLQGEICTMLEDLVQRLDDGAGAALLAVEALGPPALDRLISVLDNQPPWSTLPLLVLTCGKRFNSANLGLLRTLEALRGVTFLDRPVSIMVLITTARMALEARRHQYQIRDLLQTAERGVRYRDQFLAMLGHELRNPLAPIRQVIDIFKLQSPLPTPTLQWGIGVIDRQVKQLIHLVDDLLDVARVSQGAIRLQKETVILADIIAAAVEMAQPLINARHHQLTLSLPPKPMQLEADPVRLTQVLANLLNNAGKYTEDGGHIWLSVRQQGNDACISVRDTGIGIRAEVLPHLFEPFAQTNSAPAFSSGGLGLGLTLVRRLVEMHGGSVQAFSPGPGQGSEFVVCLPILADGSRQLTATQAAHKQGTESAAHCILIVDDNPDVAQSLTTLLRIIGHEVYAVHHGAAALEAVRSLQPEVVFLDIGLPGMDGYKVAQRLRQEYGQRLMLVALTGYGQENDRRRAEVAGFDHHLVKPVDIEDLRAVLASLGQD